MDDASVGALQRQYADAQVRNARLVALLRRAYAVMVECDWQSAAAVAGRGTGALEAEAVEVEALVAAELRSGSLTGGGG